MQLLCPQCNSVIPASSVNVSTDLAKCENCGEVFKASTLVADIDLESSLDPPAGSKVTFESIDGTAGTFRIPRSGIHARDIFPMLFATFWICFVAFWTWGAAHGGGLFALFSLPFGRLA